MPIVFALEDKEFEHLRRDFFEAERSGASSIVVTIESEELGELSEGNPIYSHTEWIECDSWKYSISFEGNQNYNHSH